jgi:subtilase family serine protease
MMRTALVFGFVLYFSLLAAAQAAKVPARITQPVDLENLVTLRGNTHPLARPEYDQGAAPDSLPTERILLVLQRSAEQEAALRNLLDEQQIKSSPNYHMWLTPEQFGQQFGPADADIQAVTDWLTSQGFQVSHVAAGRTVIEFSGTAGLVRQAFHTEIHKFVVNGVEHWANASDPQIPAALTPVVAGFASLSNFPKKPRVHRLGTFSKSKATGVVRPLFTYPYQSGYLLAVGPTDFATIYNVSPLWNAGIDGTGQTIAIVSDSNINVQDARDFRSMFGLPANDPQIILNGPDPGVLPYPGGDEFEADADVQWAGAVAKGATVDLVVSEATAVTAGVDLSALYIIDNNLAPVMSESYGACEADLGNSGNTFYSTLWEQGAAQGITILEAAGDHGSAGCDSPSPPLSEIAAQYGLAVSGNASTPFNVAVGGTDFNDFSNWPTYWNLTNSSPSQSSALSYIPEMTWNDSCANTGSSSGCASGVSASGTDLYAGGGGPSNCATSASTECTAGYAKPSWQTGTGVPPDSVRDTPDVSLFSGDGYNGSFYVYCEIDANASSGGSSSSCDLSAPYLDFQGAGGTSFSTPAFAGIIAMVNQKTGQRQGNANYVLYPLAAQAYNANNGTYCNSSQLPSNPSSCIFYDVTTGYNNSVACVGGSPNCSNTNSASGNYGILEVNPPSNSTPAWATSVGYDLATGLGSVNAANLVNNWSSIIVSDFFLSATSVTLSASAGSGFSTVTITPTGGFTGTVSLSCTNVPTGVTCTPPSTPLTLSGPSAVTATVSVTTTGQTIVVPRAPELRLLPSFRLRVWLPWLLAGLLALAMLMRLIAARRPARLAFPATLLVVGVWVACGAGGGGGGTGPPPAPAVSLSPTSLTFSSKNVGTTSTAQSVTLSNTGNATLNISSINIGGTNLGDFAQTNTCGSSVVAGSNCAISVTFTPTATGTRSASLAITDNASGSPQTVSLSGSVPSTYVLMLTASSNGLTHTVPLVLTVE